MERDTMKRAAAERAVAEIQPGMVVGLGSGSTAEIAVALLGERVSAGLSIVGVPTSEKTRALAEKLGIRLAGLDTHPRLDLVIDGADQVERGTLGLSTGVALTICVQSGLKSGITSSRSDKRTRRPGTRRRAAT